MVELEFEPRSHAVSIPQITWKFAHFWVGQGRDMVGCSRLGICGSNCLGYIIEGWRESGIRRSQGQGRLKCLLGKRLN